MKKNFIPEGVSDINYEEFEKIQSIENAVLNVFREDGYHQIMTPSFEYYDLFAEDDIADTEDMYKIVDSNGKIMVLRPDVTVPISRMVATHYKENSGEIKLMYQSNVFRSADFRAGGKREFRQAGIEYFGTRSADVDAGMIVTASRALKAAGFEDVKIELGNTGYFDGLMQELKQNDAFRTDEEALDRLRMMIESKNIPGIRAFCEAFDLPEECKAVCLALPVMYGSLGDVLKKAEPMVLNDTMKAAIADIRDLAEKLDPSIPAAVDMGLISHLEYYSGTIFRLYLKDSGVIIGSGGRYDNLMKKFGKEIPAAGLGLNIDLLYEASRSASQDQNVLNIALGKGRLADTTVEMLERVGIRFPDYSKKSRKLIFTDETGKYRIIFVKAVDVGIYVEKGACDVGVIGKDTLLESASDVHEMMDLEFGKCIFAVAAPKGFEYNPKKKLRVASKYPRVAKDHFAKYGRSIEIIKINGSVELAPLVGLSDVIVDIVETGNTLRENGLEVIEPITDISARFIVNRASLKTKPEAVSRIMDLLKKGETEA